MPRRDSRSRSGKSVQFVHVGDLHVGTSPGDAALSALAKDLRRLSGAADFIITGGDNTEAGLDAQYDTFARTFTSLSCPLYVIRGNHDFGRFGPAMRRFLPAKRRERRLPGSDELAAYIWNGVFWEERLAADAANVLNIPQPEPPHYELLDTVQQHIVILQDRYQCAYAFRQRGWKFIVVDSSLWILSGEQMAWLKQELAEGADPIILFIHHSLLPCGNQFDGAPVWNRWEILDLAASCPRVKAVFNAHLHMSRIWRFRGLMIVTTGYRCLRRVALSDGEIASISPLEPYEAEGQGQDFVNRHWFVSGRQGRMYRLRDGNLWRFRQKSPNPDAGFAWAEARPAEDIGLEWAFSVPAGDIGSRYDIRANFACRGRWALQVRQGDEILAERRGRGRGNYQV
ncbi:MAG: hypothetical protein FJ272_08710, partial [Planctomycetes bacterium]|nr:hypothetical protein [Planctomycetota bacterium]